MPRAAAAPPPLRLILMEPEIDGDTSDASRRNEWQDRLALVADRVAGELAGRALYDVLDPAPAEAELAKHRRRADVYASTSARRASRGRRPTECCRCACSG